MLSRGWQGTCQLQARLQRVAHGPTTALSGGRKIQTSKLLPKCTRPPPSTRQGRSTWATPAWADFTGCNPSASPRRDQGEQASGRLRGSPIKGKARKGPGRRQGTQLKADHLQPPGPTAGTEPWEEVRCWVEGRLSPSYPLSHLSHPTVLRGPMLARCGPPVGTKFIFLASCGNTWLCLFNFLLWIEKRWARKISLAPFDQNIAAHTSCEDTHTEKLPPPHLTIR